MPGFIELLIMALVGGLFLLVPLIIVLVVVSTYGGRRLKLTQPCPKCGQFAPQQGFCPHCGAALDTAK